MNPDKIIGILAILAFAAKALHSMYKEHEEGKLKETLFYSIAFVLYVIGCVAVIISV